MTESYTLQDFSISPVIEIKTGESKALALRNSSEAGESIHLRRERWYGLRGLAVELEEIGLSKDKPIALEASSEDLLDSVCLEQIENIGFPNLIVVWANAGEEDADSRHAAISLRSLQSKLGCEIGVDYAIAVRAASRLLAPKWTFCSAHVLEEAATEGEAYMRLLETVQTCHERGALVVAERPTTVEAKRVAIEAGVDLGLGWKWPRRAGWMQGLRGQISSRDWLARLAPTHQGEEE